MANLPELQINTRIEVEVEDSQYPGKYFSRVMDIGEKEIRIMAPALKGVVIPLHLNTQVTIHYVGERAMYSFKTVIRQRFKDALAGMSVAMPTKIERIQRREYVRLEVQLHFRYRILKGEQTQENETFLKSYIVDISGGGLKFYNDSPIPVDSILELQLAIEGIENEIIIGKVVRSRERAEGGYDIGIYFEGILPAVQDQIIGWIFNKQRDLRRKGLA